MIRYFHYLVGITSVSILATAVGVEGWRVLVNAMIAFMACILMDHFIFKGRLK